ncbi:unnamed protein product [Calypogeia fissa]
MVRRTVHIEVVMILILMTVRRDLWFSRFCRKTGIGVFIRHTLDAMDLTIRWKEFSSRFYVAIVLLFACGRSSPRELAIGARERGRWTGRH